MRRFPWLTLAVAALTTVGLVVQETVPGMLALFERTPAALHGEVWRWVTTLLVQDGHWVGGIGNVVGLLLCGVAAEQVVSRPAWGTAYVGTGLAGQVVGQLWQPTGGGNSVAVCGLAAVCVVACVRLGPEPVLLAVAPSLWAGWLAAALWTPLLLVGAVVGLAAGRTGRAGRVLVAAFVLGCTVVLLVDRDVHGGALAAGVAVALVLPLNRTD